MGLANSHDLETTIVVIISSLFILLIIYSIIKIPWLSISEITNYKKNKKIVFNLINVLIIFIVSLEYYNKT